MTSDRYYAFGSAQTQSIKFTQLDPIFPPEHSPPGTLPTYLQWKTLLQADLPLADVDGDGRADLLLWGSSWSKLFQLLITERRLEVIRQTDKGFEPYGSADPIILSDTSSTALPKGARVADLNQDGRSDLVYFVGKWYKKKGNYRWRGAWQYRLSTGAGFTGAKTLLAGRLSDPQMPSSPSLYDDNGDGYPDFLYHDVPTRSVRVLRFVPGTGAFATTSTPVRTTGVKEGAQFFTADMDGDGNSDLLHVPESSNSTEKLEVYPHNTAGRPHLITTITNGLGG